MKFTILQPVLLKSINQVSRIVGSRTTLPVLSNILIKASKGKVLFSSTDLEVAITAHAVCKVEADGEITVPARLFSDFIANNNDQSIDFELLKNNQLKLKSDHYQASIAGISAEEFPTIPTLPKELYCSIAKDDLIDAIKKVVSASASDETRPVLAGVYFDFKGKLLTLAATDSYRLAEYKLDLEKEVEEKKFIVPTRTMTEVLRLISNLGEETNIGLSSTENQVAFKIGETEVVSRLIEGAYPNYAQIIPASSKIKISADLGSFSKAVKISALFAKNISNNIQIEAKSGKLLISSINSEIGESKADVDAKITGGDLKIVFNARYIIDILSVISGDTLELSFNDEMSPGVVRIPETPNYLYIIMPLRVND